MTIATPSGVTLLCDSCYLSNAASSRKSLNFPPHLGDYMKRLTVLAGLALILLSTTRVQSRLLQDPAGLEQEITVVFDISGVLTQVPIKRGEALKLLDTLISRCEDPKKRDSLILSLYPNRTCFDKCKADWADDTCMVPRCRSLPPAERQHCSNEANEKHKLCLDECVHR